MSYEIAIERRSIINGLRHAQPVAVASVTQGHARVRVSMVHHSKTRHGAEGRVVAEKGVKTQDHHYQGCLTR